MKIIRVFPTKRTTLEVLHWGHKSRRWVSEAVCRVCQRKLSKEGIFL